MSTMTNKVSNNASSTCRLVGMICLVALVLLWGEVREAQAGCQRFGHSCFGAHGKRGGDVGATGGQQNGAELSPGESVYPAGPGAEYYPAGGFAPRVGMSPYLMDWLLSAHRGQPLSANYARQLQDDLNMADQRRK